MSLLPRLARCPTALLTVLLAAAAPAQEQAFDLRLRWLPGHTYTQETTTSTATDLTALGQPQGQKMQVTQTTVIRVKDTPAGGREARVTFEALTGEVMLQGRPQRFDSRDLSAAPAAIRASVGQSVGKSFTLVYNGDGRFVTVTDFSGLAPASPEGPSLPGVSEAREVAELYRRSLEMGLPERPVKLGETWTRRETLQFPSAGAVRSDLRAKFDGLVDHEGRRHAKISFEGELQREDGAGGTRPVMIGAGSKTFGQVLFDPERGTVSLGAFQASIRLEIDGRSIPVRQQVTTRLVKFEG